MADDLQRRWREKYDKAKLRDDVDFDTLSSVEVDPLYGPDQVDPEIGVPGEYPFTRGIYPTGYRGRLWTKRQFAGFGGPADTNERNKFLIEQGQTGLSVAFDMPTLMGRDSDEPHSEGEVGRCGVAVDSLADMEILFDEIDLEGITTSMTISGPAPMLFAMYLAAAEQQGASVDKLGGTCQTDILKEYIAQKEWLFPPEPQVRLGWEEPFLLSDVFLEDVGLAGAAELVDGGTLLLGGRKIHGEEHGGRARDRHRGRDSLEVDLVEQDLHVGQAVHGHAATADLALRVWLVGIAAHQRGHIEGDAQARLALLDQELVALVGVGRAPETRELPFGPQPPPVPGRVDAPGEGILAGDPDLGIDLVRTVERVHLDARERVEVHVVPEFRFVVLLTPASLQVISHGPSLPGRQFPRLTLMVRLW